MIRPLTTKVYFPLPFKPSLSEKIGKAEVKVAYQNTWYYVFIHELPDNEGETICNAFEDLFVQVLKEFVLPLDSIRWIEVWDNPNSQKQDYVWVNYTLKSGCATDPKWHFAGHSEREVFSAFQ